MLFEDWLHVSYFDHSEFYNYLYTLPDDEHARELETYTKQQAMLILKEDMKKSNNFYEFIRNYSPRDYTIVNSKPYVSQRVISTHVELWNSLHKQRLKTLRIFFI